MNTIDHPAYPTDLRPPWADRAACVGHPVELFFRDEHDSTSYSEARTICRTCQVRTECLNWAIETRTHYGVFGGLTPRQRRHIAAAWETSR